jgi:hypothetical protein
VKHRESWKLLVELLDQLVATEVWHVAVGDDQVASNRHAFNVRMRSVEVTRRSVTAEVTAGVSLSL